MEPLNESDLEALGLGGAQLVGPQVESDVPVTNVGYGYAAATIRAETFVADLQSNPSREDFTLKPLTTVAPGSVISRWVPDRRCVLLQLPKTGVTARWEGSAVEVAKEPLALAILPDGKRFRLLLTGASGRLVIAAQDGQLRTSAVALQVSVEPPPVDLEAIVGGQPVEPWLLEDVKRLGSSPVGFKRVAGLGLLSRLWLPPSSNRDTLSRMKLIAGGPMVRAEAWLRAVPQAARLDIEARAVEESYLLWNRLLELEASAITADEHRAELGRWWVDDRDDLESVRTMLRRLGEGEGLQNALADLDRLCAPLHTLWSMIPLPLWPRLIAVRDQEPELWWGNLANPTA